MAITDITRGYTKNLAALRRFLTGRGVNQRSTIVTSAAVYAADRIVFPGLHDGDGIASLINVTDQVDVLGTLDILGDPAVLTQFSANKGIIFTAVQPGPDGNKLYVMAQAAPAVDGVNSQPLGVEIGPHATLAGRTTIKVNLATDSSGVALTTSVNSALLVERAILTAMNIPAGGNGHIVTMDQTGSGVTAWTAFAATALSGGASYKIGPSYASLITDMDPYELSNVRYVARRAGAGGNSISVAYTAGGALAVAVTGSPDDNIVVTYVVGETTGQDVVDAVNAHAEASALVLAANAPGSDGSGLIETMTATPLAGGVDPGIRLNVASNGKKLQMTWYTEKQTDEN